MIGGSVGAFADPSDPLCFQGVVHFVLPAYDEAASIRELCADIGRVMSGHGLQYRIIVVDDGSTDGTGDRARECGAGATVTVLANERNQGLGVSLERGLRSALSAARTDDVIVTMDADLTHTPELVPAMLARHAQGADVVIASRFVPGSAVIGLSAYRRALTAAARAVMRLCMPVPGVTDFSCGFRLYSVPLLREVLGPDDSRVLVERGFAVQVELLSRIRGHGTCAEVPLVLRYDLKRTATTLRVLPAIAGYLRVLSRSRARG